MVSQAVRDLMHRQDTEHVTSTEGYHLAVRGWGDSRAYAHPVCWGVFDAPWEVTGFVAQHGTCPCQPAIQIVPTPGPLPEGESDVGRWTVFILHGPPAAGWTASFTVARMGGGFGGR